MSALANDPEAAIDRDIYVMLGSLAFRQLPPVHKCKLK